MSTKRTAVATDSDSSIHKEPDIKSLAEKSSTKKKGRRSKRLKIQHRNSQDDGDGNNREEDGDRSCLKTRSKSKLQEKIKAQSPRDINLKDVDTAQCNDNTEQSKVDKEKENETERKSTIEKKDESNDQITKSVKSKEREVEKEKEIPEYVKDISQDRNDIKYFPKSGIQYTKSKPIVMYSRNFAPDPISHVQSIQQMLETLPKVEVIPDKYRLEEKPNDFKKISDADKSKNVCDTMDVQRLNNFNCKVKNKPEGVLRKEREKNCTSISNISNNFNDCINIDKSHHLNTETLCSLNIKEKKIGAQKLSNVFTGKHVGQNEKTEQMETVVEIISNIDEFMANKFTDKKLGTLVKTGLDKNQDYINDFRQLRSIQNKKERQNFYINHCLTANRYRHILETNSNTFKCCMQLPPKNELAPPTCTESIAITPTGEKEKEDESAFSTVAGNTENNCEIIEEEIAALSDSEQHSDSGTMVLGRDNSYVGMASPNREDDIDSLHFSSISSYSFGSIEINLDELSTTSDFSEPWVEENNHSAQMVLQDTTVGLLYNVHNNSNAVLDIEIQNQPNETPMNYVNDHAEYYYHLGNWSDGNSDFYYYYPAYGPENYHYYYAANSSNEHSNYYYQSFEHENYYNYMTDSSYAYNHNYYHHQPSAPQNHYSHYYADNSSNAYDNYYYQPSAPQNHNDHYYAANSSNEYNNYYQSSAPQNHNDHYYAANSSNEYNYYQSSAPQNHYGHYTDNSSNEYNYYNQFSGSQNDYNHYSGDQSNGQYNSSYSESFDSVDYHVQENTLDYSLLYSVNAIPVLEFNGIPSIVVTQVEDEYLVNPSLHVTVQNDDAEFSNENSTSVDQDARMIENQIPYRYEQHNENSRTNFNIHIVTESSSSGYRSSSSSSYRISSSSSDISSSCSDISSSCSDISSSCSDISSSNDSNDVSSDQESLSSPVMFVHHSSCCGLEVPSDDESAVYISCPCVNGLWTNKPHAVVRPFQINSETDSDESFLS